MEKYTYIRKTVTWQNYRYKVRGKTAQNTYDKLASLKMPYIAAVAK